MTAQRTDVPWDTFKQLRSRYGNTSSWAIWQETAAVSRPKRGERRIDRPELFAVEDADHYRAAVMNLAPQRRPRSDLVFVALNFAERKGEPEREDLAAFHEVARNDEKLRLALQQVGAEGCYLTDLVKVPLASVRQGTEKRKALGDYVTSPLRLTDSGRVVVSADGHVTVPGAAVAHLKHEAGYAEVVHELDHFPRRRRPAEQAGRSPEPDASEASCAQFDPVPAFLAELDLLRGGRDSSMRLIPVGAAVARTLHSTSFKARLSEHQGITVADGYLPHYSNWGSAAAYVERVAAAFSALVPPSVRRHAN